MTYDQLPIRLQASTVSAPPVAPVDANTGQRVRFWRGQGLAVQVGVFDLNGEAVNLSNLSYLQLIVQESSASPTALLVSQVNSGSIVPLVTKDAWDAGANQQATFTLTPAQTDFSLGAAAEADFWMALVGVTTGGANLVYAAGPITIYNAAASLPMPPPAVYTSAETLTNGGGPTVVTPMSPIHHAEVVVSGVAETRNIVVGAQGLHAGATCVVRFQLPATDGIYLRVYDQSALGTLLTTLVTQSDGFLPASRVALWFDGSNWKRDSLIQPAFGPQT